MTMPRGGMSGEKFYFGNSFSLGFDVEGFKLLGLCND